MMDDNKKLQAQEEVPEQEDQSSDIDQQEATRAEINANPLYVMQSLKGMLSEREEITFMNILFSSSATIRAGYFGLSRKEVEKQLGLQAEEKELFFSFLQRVNQGVSRYFKIIYDERRDQVVAMMRVPARTAKSTLSKESLAILLFMFYQQEVLRHDFTLFEQLLEAFGHETTKANQRLLLNLDQLRKIGALEDYEAHSAEKAYQLTAIGVHIFSDSFLRRTAEFSQSNQLNKEEVLKFFKRYNLYRDED